MLLWQLVQKKLRNCRDIAEETLAFTFTAPFFFVSEIKTVFKLYRGIYKSDEFSSCSGEM